MTGSLAVTVAVIAVAWIGLMLLTGKMNPRVSARTILGCFIVFGAGGLAAALLSLGSPSQEAEIAAISPAPVAPITSPIAAPPSKPQTPSDPYAGAVLQQPR
ncbi:TrbC/VirB2 family protein [Sphingomonas ginsengisoli (ex An et al. 2013)]